MDLRRLRSALQLIICFICLCSPSSVAAHNST